MYNIDCSRCSDRDRAAEDLERAFRDMPGEQEPDSRLVWVPIVVLAGLVLAVWCGYSWYCEIAARIMVSPGA